jgi:hypothetical protein
MKVKITIVPENRKEVATCRRFAAAALDPNTDIGKLVQSGSALVKWRTVRVAKVPRRKKRV